MDIPTVPGSLYTVATKTTCDITDAATGTPIDSVSSGSVTFTAQGTVTTLSDPAATYSKVNFKNAAAALRLLGGGDQLPSGYLSAEFLDVNTSKSVNIGYRYLQDETTGLQVVAEYVKKNPNVVCQFTQAGGGLYTRPYIYPDLAAYYWGKKYNLGWVDGKVTSSVNFKNNKLAIHGSNAVALTNTPTSDELAKTPRLVILVNFHGKCWSLKISQGSSVIADFCPAITQNGKAAFFDRVTGFEMTLDEWVVGLTIEQARKLGALTAGGGTLKISLPENYTDDEAVVAALSTATENGWIFEIQTYTTAEAAASTFALRRIWVKKTADPAGAYVDANGARWHVEWCQTVLGAEPTDLGYEPGRSVDVALAEWELTPYIYPEEEPSSI